MKIYEDFGDSVEFEMVPFLYGSASNPHCFDERSPCTEEQTAYCVIDIAQKADPDSRFPGQNVIVPWQICHSKGNSMETCHEQVGIDSSEVASCLSDKPRIKGLMEKNIARASNIRGTPTEYVDGKTVDSSYKAVKKAICNAESSLAACSAAPAALV